jgi:hypothetical protein
MLSGAQGTENSPDLSHKLPLYPVYRWMQPLVHMIGRVRFDWLPLSAKYGGRGGGG